MRFIALLIIAALMTACARPSSDEDQLRKLIDTAKTSAQARDASALLAFVGADYQDSNGFDKTRLQNFLRGYFFTHPKADFLVTLGEFEFPQEGLARVEVSLVRLELSNPERVHLSVEFRSQDSRWRVSRAEELGR